MQIPSETKINVSSSGAADVLRTCAKHAPSVLRISNASCPGRFSISGLNLRDPSPCYVQHDHLLDPPPWEKLLEAYSAGKTFRQSAFPMMDFQGQEMQHRPGQRVL